MQLKITNIFSVRLEESGQEVPAEIVVFKKRS